uniref:hypothetical protein n=1 Tax=Haslea provincialis TaxID=1764367 RepID=UPI00220EF2D2|nr:hypothetical protein ON925_mgp34 [Haslea provincialis]UXN44225.1 hypothetical protein [Haslea provincialis]
MVLTNKNIYLREKLDRSYLNLMKKTLQYIKDSHQKPIHPKEDPELFVNLIVSFMKADSNVLQKILLKIKSRPYIENFPFNSEIFNIITLPLCNTTYFTCLHMETQNEDFRDNLLDYFRYTEKEITDYLLTSSQILDLTSLMTENKTDMIKKIRSLKYTNGKNLFYLRKGLQLATIPKKINLEAKHVFLTVQLTLIKSTLQSETYKDIYFFRNLLTDFLFLSKLTT